MATKKKTIKPTFSIVRCRNAGVHAGEDALAVLPQDEADRVRRHLWRAMGVRS